MAAELTAPSSDIWKRFGDEVLRLEIEAFGSGAFEAVYLESEFTDPDNTLVLLREVSSGRLIGFTCAVPAVYVAETWNDDLVETAHIIDTIIDERYRGHGLVGAMMAVLEEELRRRGFRYIERDAAVANGYAGKIARAYSGRIVYRGEPHDSEWGPQVQFRIRL